jgi:hypothetical protein
MHTPPLRGYKVCNPDDTLNVEENQFLSLLTSGPFWDFLSAAFRPKRGGAFRQAKGREFDPTRVDFVILLTGHAIKGTLGNLGRQKEKELISIVDQNWSQLLMLN